MSPPRKSLRKHQFWNLEVAFRSLEEAAYSSETIKGKVAGTSVVLKLEYRL